MQCYLRSVIRDLGTLSPGRKTMFVNVHTVDLNPGPAADCLLPGECGTADAYAMPITKCHARVNFHKGKPCMIQAKAYQDGGQHGSTHVPAAA